MTCSRPLIATAIAVVIGSAVGAYYTPVPPRHPQPGAGSARPTAAATPLFLPSLLRSAAAQADSPAEQRAFAGKSLEELNAEQPLRDVFFDSNQVVVTGTARATLQENAAWLKKWSSTAITVEGHGDSRGTSEYNFAIGTRRATAVKDVLVTLGIGPDRVTVESKGTSLPVCDEEDVVAQLEPPFPGCVACHLERCWQENRRAHFTITAK